MHTSAIQGLAIDRGGRFAVSGGDEGTIRVWSVSDGRLRPRILREGRRKGQGDEPQKRSRYCAAMSPNLGHFAASNCAFFASSSATAPWAGWGIGWDGAARRADRGPAWRAT